MKVSDTSLSEFCDSALKRKGVILKYDSGPIENAVNETEKEWKIELEKMSKCPNVHTDTFFKCPH